MIGAFFVSERSPLAWSMLISAVSAIQFFLMMGPISTGYSVMPTRQCTDLRKKPTINLVLHP